MKGFRLTALFSLLLLVALHAQPLMPVRSHPTGQATEQSGCCTQGECVCCAGSEDGCHCGCAETASPVVATAYFCPNGCEPPGGEGLLHLHTPDYLPERNLLDFLTVSSALGPGASALTPAPPLREVPEPPPRAS